MLQGEGFVLGCSECFANSAPDLRGRGHFKAEQEPPWNLPVLVLGERASEHENKVPWRSSGFQQFEEELVRDRLGQKWWLDLSTGCGTHILPVSFLLESIRFCGGNVYDHCPTRETVEKVL